uniref:RNA-dependent RNA polymerase n=1 Tax=Dali Botou tick virus 1 TaxID=2972083 RepID=A0A9E7V219_9VIRU|nr:MAG: RNA-dependent RNA polymerase [Dali Botou tick virus 1]
MSSLPENGETRSLPAWSVTSNERHVEWLDPSREVTLEGPESTQNNLNYNTSNHSNSQQNTFEEDDMERYGPNGCKWLGRNAKLLGMAFSIQNAENRYMKKPELQKRKSTMTCKELKTTIKSMTDVYSAKSVKKIQECKYCMDHLNVDEFKKKMGVEDRDIDKKHLNLFRKAVSIIIDRGWDRRTRIGGDKRVFVPNGASTLQNKRSEGGNWCKGMNKFEPLARVTEVDAGGKMRLITIFDESMSVMRAMHKTLFDYITKRKIHVRGEFTKEDVAEIERSGEGDFISGDFSSATDNIKRAYVDAVVDVLLEKAEYIDSDEREALRNFGRVIDVETGEEWAKGQPMGSLMSFPILCIWNRALFEMTLAEETKRLRIPYGRASKIMAKINGDDIAFREISKDGQMMEKWRRNCLKAGVIVNEQKTGKSPNIVELNSKTYVNGEKVRTINWKCLNLNPDCEDILVVINDCVKSESARMALAHMYAGSIARAKEKHVYRLPKSTRESLKKKVKGEIGKKKKNVVVKALMNEGSREPFTQKIKTMRWCHPDIPIDSVDKVRENFEKKVVIDSIRRTETKFTSTLSDYGTSTWSAKGKPEKRVMKINRRLEIKEEKKVRVPKRHPALTDLMNSILAAELKPSRKNSPLDSSGQSVLRTWDMLEDPPEKRSEPIINEWTYRALIHQLRQKNNEFQKFDKWTVSPSFVKNVPRGAQLWYKPLIMNMNRIAREGEIYSRFNNENSNIARKNCQSIIPH